MSKYIHPVSKMIVILIIVVAISCNACASFGARDREANATEKSEAINEAELQSKIMSFADLYASLLPQGFQEYDATKPSNEKRRLILSSVVYSMSSAFTIAAESDPDVALLDMVVMVTLGRLIFEDHWQKVIGAEVDPIIQAFRVSERQIWNIAGEVLTAEQQNELMDMIVERHRKYPHVRNFAYIRFSDFAAERRKSTLLRGEKADGLFQSVETATQQVEEMRLLAERGMYLGTRLPMMTGAFADTWLSQLFINPEVSRLTNDFHKFAAVSERLAVIAETLPKQVTKEREAAINQAMQQMTALTIASMEQLAEKVAKERSAAITQFIREFSEERQKTFRDFLDEEKRLRTLLAELRGTLNDGTNLLTSANTLAGTLNLGKPDPSGKPPSKPIDIKDVKATLNEASNTIKQVDGLVQSFDRLMVSPGWKNSLPRIAELANQIEEEGRAWVTYAALLGIGLILFFLVGSVFAALVYKYVSLRIFAADGRGGHPKVVLPKTA